jgi:hypothetical protein
MTKAPITAKELIEFAAPKAAEMFETTGGLRPLWHIVCANGDHGVVASPFDGAEDKDLVAMAMREVFEKVDAVAFVFMCESWFRTGKDEIDVNKVMREGLHDDPKRQECLWYAAEDMQGEVTAYQLIERPEGPDGPGVLQPLTWLNRSARVEGRFVGMLPTRGRTKH